MLKKVTLHGRNGTRVLEIKPRGFGTRHIRTRVAPPPLSTPKPRSEVSGTPLFRSVLSSQHSTGSPPLTRAVTAFSC